MRELCGGTCWRGHADAPPLKPDTQPPLKCGEGTEEKKSCVGVQDKQGAQYGCDAQAGDEIGAEPQISHQRRSTGAADLAPPSHVASAAPARPAPTRMAA